MDYNGSRLYLLRPSHLLGKLTIKRHSPEIDTAVLDRILTAYGEKIINPPRYPSNQGRSQSMVLHTITGKKILKSYKPSVTPSAVICEHSVLTYLTEKGFSVPRLQVTTDGKTWLIDGHKLYVMFDFINGGFQYHQYILLPGQVRQFTVIAGQVLSDLHQQLKDFEPAGQNPDGFASKTQDRPRNLDWVFQKLAACLKQAETQPHQNKQTTLLLKQADRLNQQLTTLDAYLLQADLPRQTIHGDYGPYNLLFRPHAPITVLDFELTRLDWRITDIADSFLRFGYDPRLGFKLNKMAWFLAGYQANLPLTANEAAAMPALWQYLHLRRAVINWHHYYTTLDSRRLTKANWHLKAAAWMDARQKEINNLLCVSSSF